MTSLFGGPQAQYLGTAIFFLGIAYTLIRWVGRALREQIGAGDGRSLEGLGPPVADAMQQALAREAIQRGLVTPSQLAGMSMMERQFVFASLKEKLGTPAAVAAPRPVAPQATGGTSAAAAPRPRALNGAEFGVVAVPAGERQRVYCPMCGNRLDLPAFVPLVARCERCGAKSAVREEEGGRFVILVSPPPPPDSGHERPIT